MRFRGHVDRYRSGGGGLTRLLPREHGAYGQLALPLVTSFAVAGITTPAVLLGVTAVAAFLAHEPLLVLLGRRGVRARRDDSRPASVWLAVTTASAVGAGLLATGLVSPAVRWSLLLPLGPAAVLAAAIAAKREKGVESEIAVALAFSLLAVPVCLAAGASIATALAVSIPFASIFMTGTLAVRVIVFRVRGGGDPRAVCAARWSVLAVAAAAAATFAAAIARAGLPSIAPGAAAPGLLAALWMAMFPPPAARLRAVGWTLVATSVAAGIILVVGLSGQL